ncbi:MAG: alkaline phosphatase [Chthoniobacteraceae bacterium]
MKLRNQLLALACLALFGALGVFYFRSWVAPKPFGIIVFISDALSTRQLTAARLYEGGADHRLALDGFPNAALVRNAARDFAVPDAAAAASAIATGQRGAHRQLALDAGGAPLRTLAEIARREGRSVGIVTNGRLTDPTVAAFYAHLADSRDKAAVAAQFALQTTLDVALGGGASDFPPDALKQRGAIFTTKAELEGAANFQDRRVVGLFAPGDLPHADQIESGSQQPSLADMVRRAIEFLQTNRSGYLLVVDTALVTRAAEGNEGERTLVETLAFDHAVATATRYAGERSLIVAAGKHAIGGLTLNGFPLRQDHGIALLGINPAGYPTLTWSTGPNGPQPNPTPAARNEPAAFAQPTALLTAEDMVVLARGQGADKLHGIIDATEIFDLLRGAL